MTTPRVRFLYPVSLLANIGLAAVLVFLLVARHSAARHPRHQPAQSPAPAHAPSRPLWPELSPATLDALRAHDPAAEREALTLAGFPSAQIRKHIASQVRKDYEKRIAALHPYDPQAWWQQPPWKPENYLEGDARDQARRLKKEMREQIARALGPLGADPNLFRKSELAAIPEAKRQAVANLEADYGDLLEDLETDMRDFALPGDAEQRALLQSERRRELAALLTPEELRDYDRANTTTALFIHAGAARIAATAEEFNRIYELSRPYYEETLRPGAIFDDKKARERLKEKRDGMIELLGDERYRLFAREENYDYKGLVQLATRLNLPAGTADRVYELREQLAAACARIDQDTALDRDRKRAALARAADDLRAQAKTLLGNEAGQAWLDSDSAYWVNNVAKGDILTCDPVTGEIDDVKRKYR
ncbi:hypothetical protein OPIT5_25350 [Opitutaceae bacterium TAV5]|nr:hypothetical protein OPIT5_25350 [Opitutaceae bacterium TAV5]